MNDRKDSSSAAKPVHGLGSQHQSAPYLPYEILSLIIKQCPISSYFRLTQVNTTFRKIVYSHLPTLDGISRELAIHLLNHQEASASSYHTNDSDHIEDDLFAPRFSLEEYNRYMTPKADMLRRTVLWDDIREQTSGNCDIDVLRCDMAYHRRADVFAC